MPLTHLVLRKKQTNKKVKQIISEHRVISKSPVDLRNMLINRKLKYKVVSIVGRHIEGTETLARTLKFSLIALLNLLSNMSSIPTYISVFWIAF